MNTFKNTNLNVDAWTETSKLNSSRKNFLKSTEDGSCQGKTRKKDIKIVCPECNQKFKNKKGKLPEHKNSYGRVCSGDKTKTFIDYFVHNDEIFEIGDEVIVETNDWVYCYSAKRHVLKVWHGKIASILDNVNGYYYITFDNKNVVYLNKKNGVILKS